VTGIRDYLRRDGLLLLAALLLAVLVWSYVNDELTETRTVTPRFEPEVPEGLTVARGAPREVTVVLRGTRRSLNALDAVRLTARCKLPARPGPVQVVLRPSDLSLPQGVEIFEDPPPFELELEYVGSRKVPVRVETAGQPAPGFAVAGVPFAEPAEVEIQGRREAIEGVKQVAIRPIDLTGKTRAFSSDAQLLAPPDTRTERERVLVFVDIAPVPEIREISGVEVRVLAPSGFESRVRVEPALVAVRLRGAPTLLAGLALNPRDIGAVVDLSALPRPLKADMPDQPVRLILPPGASLAPEASVPRVRVLIGEK